MTQLDVPTISFTHYLDLLKRRTWHVVIMSILGLVVGGVVAMLIPRYYVAHTTIELNRPILDPKLGTPLDPFSQLINAAIVTVPAGVQKALLVLKWIEAIDGPDEEQRAFRRATRGRISVDDRGPRNKGRRIAHLRITYKDLDGVRAAAMANELRKQWLAEFVDGLVVKAELEVLSFVRDKQAKSLQKQRAAREVQVYEETNGINPENWKDPRASGIISVISNEIRLVRTEIANLKAEINGLARKLANRKALMDATSPTLRANVEDLPTDPTLRKEYLMLFGTIQYTTRLLFAIKPAHPDYGPAKLTRENARIRLVELQKIAGGASPEQLNPAYENLEKEVRNLTDDMGVKNDTLIERQSRLQKLAEEKKRLPGIYFKYEDLRERLQLFQSQEVSLTNKLEEKQAMIRRIQTERPARLLATAYPPPAPTDPNPYILAMMGCIVGLAVAIALVLLIDFLQMSFKSVADVESGLGLPVLGTMTFLETDEESASTRDRRTRLTIFAVVFLVLLFTIVTLYYVMPTSLPPFVVNLLEDVLGPRK
jgi:uncharacterized protein involved in exopolysaccharide biosynthesis